MQPCSLARSALDSRLISPRVPLLGTAHRFCEQLLQLAPHVWLLGLHTAAQGSHEHTSNTVLSVPSTNFLLCELGAAAAVLLRLVSMCG